MTQTIVYLIAIVALIVAAWAYEFGGALMLSQDRRSSMRRNASRLFSDAFDLSGLLFHIDMCLEKAAGGGPAPKSFNGHAHRQLCQAAASAVMTTAFLSDTGKRLAHQEGDGGLPDGTRKPVRLGYSYWVPLVIIRLLVGLAYWIALRMAESTGMICPDCKAFKGHNEGCPATKPEAPPK